MATNIVVARDKRHHLEEADDLLHIVGREWCFEWWQKEIDTVIDLWKRGYGLTIIARRVGSTPRDTFLLLIELSEQGKIKPRPGYVWGAM